MNYKKFRGSNAGFTLIEIIAVLVVLGILAAIAIPKYVELGAYAKDAALKAGIAELNGREAIAWAQQMITTKGAPVDDTVFAAFDRDLGTDYTWSGAAPSVSGGTLVFSGYSKTVNRTACDTVKPGNWKM